MWRRKNFRSVLTVAASAAVLAGWWYWRTPRRRYHARRQSTTRRWVRVPLVELLRLVPQIRRRIAVDFYLLRSHLERRMELPRRSELRIYHFFALIVLAGIQVPAIKRPPNLFPLVVFYFFFASGWRTMCWSRS